MICEVSVESKKQSSGSKRLSDRHYLFVDSQSSNKNNFCNFKSVGQSDSRKIIAANYYPIQLTRHFTFYTIQADLSILVESTVFSTYSIYSYNHVDTHCTSVNTHADAIVYTHIRVCTCVVCEFVGFNLAISDIPSIICNSAKVVTETF